MIEVEPGWWRFTWTATEPLIERFSAVHGEQDSSHFLSNATRRAPRASVPDRARESVRDGHASRGVPYVNQLLSFGNDAVRVYRHGLGRIAARAAEARPTTNAGDSLAPTMHRPGIEAHGIRNNDLWAKWSSACAFAGGDGFRRTPSAAREKLEEIVGPILAKCGLGSYPHLRDLWEGLGAILRFEYLLGSHRFMQGRCSVCGTLHTRNNGCCRLAVVGCAGTVQEVDSVQVVGAENERLLHVLRDALERASVEVLEIAGGTAAILTGATHITSRQAEGAAASATAPPLPTTSVETATPEPPCTSNPPTTGSAKAAPRGRLLLSWQDILEALGLPDERKHETRIKRLNEKRGGPIVYIGNKPKVFSEELLRWIDGLGKATEDGEDDSTDADLELDHPAELRERGFQPKVRPNNVGSLAQKSGYERN